LNGNYAFVFKGFDSSGNPALVGGVLTFNGTNNNGLITAGTMDMNLLSGFDSANFGNPMTVSSGSYSVGSDQRGCMTVTTVAGTQHYRLSVGNITSGVASVAHVIQFDTTGLPSSLFTAGRMYLQSGGPFSNSSINGSYAFGGSSPQSGGGKFGIVGELSFNGSGVVTSGEEDFNQDGSLDDTANTSWPASAIPITGGSYSVSSNGRSTLTVTISGQNFHIVFYAVSISEVLLMTSDPQTSSNVFGGESFKQPGSFSANPLSGTYVGYDSGLGNGGAGTDRIDIYVLGPMTSGSNALTGTQLRNDAGTFRQQSLAGETYSVSSTGRMIVAGVGGPVLYLVNSSQAFLLAANGSVDSGFFQSQTGGSFSSSTVSGTYAYGVIDPEAAGSSIFSGVALFANPNLTVTEDDNSDGTLTVGSAQNFTYSVDSTGLGEIPVPPATSCTVSASSTTCQTLFYLISPTKAVVLDATSSDPKITIADK
jgi:hypothetical protein